ncbi:pilus assembly protein HofP [Serratia fonticola]|uniref:Pilus assembly protein HofP n=1 Tax=Serratia fonticola TaxID=47917 RepID=A0A542BGK0_SERFO|nr:DNA utilization family protein [Serratia fonticola]TQI77712.1 pilus assembly protein HofP [Serratia fonticola]TQI95294.1 pilus assembly protein HofP [Serratia fonticola]TVZ69789.1 pilus assembly protein HofP [Serratia fonticola]
MNKLCWAWLLFSTPLYAKHFRDPFQPPQMMSCIPPAVSPAGWQLKGIIGTPDLRYAWVKTSQGQWMGLHSQQWVLDGVWQVLQIRPRQLELGVQDLDDACPPLTGNVVLTLGTKS